jgi:hypothetical protein
MLMVTELAEAVEGIRKNLQDDKIPERRMEEVEMADVFIRALDFAFGFDLGKLTQIEQVHSDALYEQFYIATNKSQRILYICRQISDVEMAVGREAEAYQLSLVIKMVAMYCEEYHLDLMGAYREKMEFNRVREDHTHEARKAANGKKF